MHFHLGLKKLNLSSTNWMQVSMALRAYACVNMMHKNAFTKGSLRHAVYTCGKCMRFQSQLGQTKVDFNNQGKNAPQCVAF